ncbi:MAG: hypothetical protein ACXVBW_04695, partial [Bdellovibrionota bacterium]
MTEQLKFLLILYSGIVLFNVLISAWLFLSNRNRMFGALFVAWMALFLTFLGQGLLRDRLNAAILVGTPTTFLGNLGLCDLLIFALGQHHHVARSLRIFAVGYAVTVMMTLLPVPYWNKTLPVMLGATIPILISITELFSRCPWKTVSNPKRAYAGVLLVLIFHELNSPFTVNRPELAIWGFTITAIIVFAMSIFGPMLAIEATEAETAALKIQHQALERDMEVTLAVQSLLLPKASDYSFNGIDIASFYRSATRAGGDWWWVDQREDGT